MVKLIYYSGSIEYVSRIIDEQLVDCPYNSEEHNPELFKAINEFIKKNWSGTIYYHRLIDITQTKMEKGFVDDFGSHSEFVKVEVC